ncbi:chlorocatechol-degradation protein [Mycena belliarum]|uniref:Chlorocatechol-degradation protein n=1 Tax=Mycena belliarum TaxID=1033014 RepID=A0AAD6UN21_9AGAR|nr:chlorocatechol-degradation protein [Mycena belliae]
MKLFLCLPFLAAVQAAIVPAIDPKAHFHPSVPNAAKPQGKNVTINGVLTYVSLPKTSFDNTTALVLLLDGFGLPSIDNLILADQWAAAGFQTFVPDYLNGDPIAADGDLATWLLDHGEAQTTPPLLAVIHALKERGIKRIAATGYCFGGLYTTRLVQNNTVTVATMSDPSLLNVPTDFDLMKEISHIPIEINNAELDPGFSPAVAAETDKVMANGQYTPGYARRQFNGVAHGFAVRANASDPVQVAAKQGAFDTSLAWLKAHLE